MCKKLLLAITPPILIVCLATWGALTIGWPVVLIVAGSGVVGYVLWLRFSFKQAISPKDILPGYCFTVALLMLHINEEYYRNFPGAMSDLFGIHFTMSDFIAIFMLAGPVLYWFVAAGLFYKNRLANYFAWFILIGPGVMEFTHYIFPLLVAGPGYHYFPGMYTAWMPMVPGIWTIVHIVRKYKNATTA